MWDKNIQNQSAYLLILVERETCLNIWLKEKFTNVWAADWRLGRRLYSRRMIFDDHSFVRSKHGCNDEDETSLCWAFKGIVDWTCWSHPVQKQGMASPKQYFSGVWKKFFLNPQSVPTVKSFREVKFLAVPPPPSPAPAAAPPPSPRKVHSRDSYR